MKLRDVLNDAIKYDESFIAYWIYWVSTKGKSLDDEYDTITEIKWNTDEIKELMEQNPLGLNAVQVYSHRKGKEFYLFLARNKEEALKGLYDVTGDLTGEMLVVPNGIHKALWDVENRRTECLFTLKNSLIDFPHFIGIFKRDIDSREEN